VIVNTTYVRFFFSLQGFDAETDTYQLYLIVLQHFVTDNLCFLSSLFIYLCTKTCGQISVRF